MNNVAPETEEMAIKYNNLPDEFNDIPDYKLEAFRKLINKQFCDISQKIFFEFVDYEPFGENPKIAHMLRLSFYKGFISIHTTGNDSKVWGKFHNLQFRAIHDYIHCLHKLEFNHENEKRAFNLQMQFSYKYAEQFPNIDWDLYRNVLRSEIVYQSAYKETFGQFHIDQKIILKDL